MGYNTTVIIRNDAARGIAKDPDFGKKVVEAMAIAMTPEPARTKYHGHGSTDISSGPDANAATVVESHHADMTAIVAVGGNYATQIGMVLGYAHHRPEDIERILREVAGQHGFRLVKKRKK